MFDRLRWTHIVHFGIGEVWKTIDYCFSPSDPFDEMSSTFSHNGVVSGSQACFSFRFTRRVELSISECPRCYNAPFHSHERGL